MSSTLETSIVLPAILVILLTLITIGSNLCGKTQNEFQIEYIAISDRSQTDKLYDAKIIYDEKKEIYTKSVMINPVIFILTVDFIKDISGSFIDIKNDLFDIFGKMS